MAIRSDKNVNSNQTRRNGSLVRRLQVWFKIFSILLLALIVARLFGLQIFVEIEFDGEPIQAALTSIETYLIPLGLVLVYFLLAWAWHRFFGSDRS